MEREKRKTCRIENFFEQDSYIGSYHQEDEIIKEFLCGRSLIINKAASLFYFF